MMSHRQPAISSLKGYTGHIWPAAYSTPYSRKFEGKSQRQQQAKFWTGPSPSALFVPFPLCGPWQSLGTNVPVIASFVLASHSVHKVWFHNPMDQVRWDASGAGRIRPPGSRAKRHPKSPTAATTATSTAHNTLWNYSGKVLQHPHRCIWIGIWTQKYMDWWSGVNRWMDLNKTII